jgi:hypothetical protein
MNGRPFRLPTIVALLLLAALVSEAFMLGLMITQTTPHPIEVLRNPSETERSIIALFERVWPSVVQVFGRQT